MNTPIYRQILPQSLLMKNIPISEEDYLAQLKNANKPVFVYMHGNSGNRGSSHRVELYKLFQKLDFHVICFDYRSKMENFTHNCLKLTLNNNYFNKIYRLWGQ